MNILVVGSGGREHTLAWKIHQSADCTNLYVAPGNAGTASIARNIEMGVNDFDKISQFIKDNEIDLVVVGPEEPLVKGLRDFLESKGEHANLGIIGPDKQGALLEGSKDFSKDFLERYNIPTATSKTFTSSTVEEGLAYLRTKQLPIVLKADGLAAGKGVIISPSYEEAEESLKDMLLNERFGQASAKVLIEDYLDGIEVSVFVLTDGKDYVILPEAKDYKRIGEKDTGPNTGGMGAVSPVPFADVTFMSKVEDRIIKPTISGLQQEGIKYVGFLFLGLMNMNGDPYIIEYNVRMGDPESQAVLPRIQGDFLEILKASAHGRLAEIDVEIDSQHSATVVMASEGYPGSYEKGMKIWGLGPSPKSKVFHAGTSQDGEFVVTNGGRVLAVTGMGSDLREALTNAYSGVEDVTWDGVQFRRDIGKDILALQE
jgi:phosphoribosylamine--glycine ligase